MVGVGVCLWYQSLGGLFTGRPIAGGWCCQYGFHTLEGVVHPSGVFVSVGGWFCWCWS